MESTKDIVVTKNAPEAIGPYSQAVRYGNLLFISGQIPIDPLTGDILGDRIEQQTQQVLKNLRAIVEASGMSLSNVLKTTCFLKNIEDFSNFNRVYGQYFQMSYPARETVEVSGLPRGVLVEVSCICGK